jgi:hypothetical protein
MEMEGRTGRTRRLGDVYDLECRKAKVGKEGKSTALFAWVADREGLGGAGS